MKRSTTRHRQIRPPNRPRAAVLAAATFSVALVPTVVGVAAASASPSPWETVHEVYDTPPTFENFCGVQGLTVVAVRLDQLPPEDDDTRRGRPALLHRAGHLFRRHLHQQGHGGSPPTPASTGSRPCASMTTGTRTLTIVYQYTVDTRITNDAGHVVAHNTGLYRYVSVVDHNGTPSDPGDDTELESSDLLTTGWSPTRAQRSWLHSPDARRARSRRSGSIRAPGCAGSGGSGR